MLRLVAFIVVCGLLALLGWCIGGSS